MSFESVAKVSAHTEALYCIINHVQWATYYLLYFCVTTLYK